MLQIPRQIAYVLDTCGLVVYFDPSDENTYIQYGVSSEIFKQFKTLINGGFQHLVRQPRVLTIKPNQILTQLNDFLPKPYCEGWYYLKDQPTYD